MTPADEQAYELPMQAVPLDLELSLPKSCLSALRRGHESQSQDEKWSLYCRGPWVEIWRPNSGGRCFYTARFAEADGTRIKVMESWVARCAIESGLGSDLEHHRAIAAMVIDAVAGFHGEFFGNGTLQGTRGRKEISFRGTARSFEDVDVIARQLREQVERLHKDTW